jgi:sec-independent protein translocase protein TatA
MMGDFGKGIKSFKQGMADETTDRPVTPPPAQITPPQPPVQASAQMAADAPVTTATPTAETMPGGATPPPTNPSA